MKRQKKIAFTKMVASGNDFVVVEGRLEVTGYRLEGLVKKLCDRKYGIGADGVLLLEKSKAADIRMRVFNADGSEAEMCGNGARCAALYCINHAPCTMHPAPRIETAAGIIQAQVNSDKVKIKLTGPKDIKMDIGLKVNNRRLRVNFINTGVPHTVIFVEGIDKIEAVNIGRQIRRDKRFAPQGTNVDFVEALDKDSLKIRTYERGVEDETLACGTGVVAAALLSAVRYPLSANKINVLTRSGEILKVYFEREGNNFKDIWLEGKARIVYKGEYYV